jgi:hypothetical protein
MAFLLFVALCAFGLGVTAVALHYRKELEHITVEDARLLTKLPVTRIADASEGLVKIVGTVVQGEQTVMSYFDRVPCVARRIEFRTHVDTQLSIGLTGIRTVDITEVERELKVFAFAIEDGSGRVDVDPRQVRFDFEVAGGEEGSSVYEHRIRVGEKVAAIGRIRVTRGESYRAASDGVRGTFTDRPLVSWRSDAEFFPKLRPPTLAFALFAVSVLSAGAYTYQVMERNARHEAWLQRHPQYRVYER